jgi:hypothetical protein
MCFVFVEEHFKELLCIISLVSIVSLDVFFDVCKLDFEIVNPLVYQHNYLNYCVVPVDIILSSYFCISRRLKIIVAVLAVAAAAATQSSNTFLFRRSI